MRRHHSDRCHRAPADRLQRQRASNTARRARRKPATFVGRASWPPPRIGHRRPSQPGLSACERTNTANANPSIWALGLRNPFTFAFQPGAPRMFINDVGQDIAEEINEGVKGANYGWGDFVRAPAPRRTPTTVILCITIRMALRTLRAARSPAAPSTTPQSCSSHRLTSANTSSSIYAVAG